MGHLRLRYEGAYESALPTFSDIGIWDIVDRAPVVRLDEIEKMLGEAIKQGGSAIHRPGRAPVTVDRWSAVFLGRWNRKVLTEVLTQLSIDAFRIGSPGWYNRACRYVRFKNYTLELAVETAVLRYLADGDARPLLYLTWRGYVPSAKVGKHVAAMLTRSSRIFYIGFKPKRGRPRKRKNANLEKRNAVSDCISINAELLAVGEYAPHRFWDFLLAALYKDQRPAVEQKYRLKKPFSVEARFEYNKHSPDHAGNSEDLDLVERNIRIAELFQDCIDRDEPVTNKKFCNKWNAGLSPEQTISESTLKKIKTAYKIRKPPRVRKPRRPPRVTIERPGPEGTISDWSTDKFGNRERTKTRD
jgi:hypothetical protein